LAGLFRSLVYNWVGMVLGTLSLSIVVMLRGQLSSPMTLPIWLVALPWLLLSVIAIPRLIAVGTEKLAKTKRWRRYTGDHFFGYDWRWEYRTNRRGQHLVENLQALCPRCDKRMIISVDVFPAAYVGQPVTGPQVKCESCGYQGTIGMPVENGLQFAKMVLGEITRGIRRKALAPPQFELRLGRFDLEPPLIYSYPD